jgi:hypothetical protein
MNQALEMRKTADGKVFARRKDGLPLTAEDREEVRKLALSIPPPCWNCGATMSPTHDIYGNSVFVCWSCAKSA